MSLAGSDRSTRLTRFLDYSDIVEADFEWPDGFNPQPVMELQGHRVAILGSGALASVYILLFSALGCDVQLWADPEHRSQYNVMKERGYVETAVSVKGRFKVTFCDNLEDALADTPTICALTPVQALPDLWRQMKALYDGPLVSSRAVFKRLLLIPASLESISARLIFDRAYPDHIYEVSSAAITSKWDPDTATAQVKRMKGVLEIAVQGNGGQIKDAEFALLKKVFPNPELKVESNMIRLFFKSIGSRIHHVALVGARDIFMDPTRNSEVFFYRDLVGSEEAEKLILRYDAVLADAYARFGGPHGWQPITELLNQTYPSLVPGHTWSTPGEWARSPGAHNAQRMTPAPGNLKKHRFFLEDGRHAVRVEKLCQITNMYPEEYEPVTFVIDQLSEMAGVDLRALGDLNSVGLSGCESKRDVEALAFY